jgi:hypothetical protein
MDTSYCSDAAGLPRTETKAARNAFGSPSKPTYGSAKLANLDFKIDALSRRPPPSFTEPRVILGLT